MLNYNNLTMTEGKKLVGVPLFADIRNFTKQFDSLDANLEEMAIKTSRILRTMYDVVVNGEGVHIQFQGDREMALFHNINNGITIGVGSSFGNLIATKFGARGNKDNILLGRTINEADSLEDKGAKEGEIVISKKLYEVLKKENRELASVFTFRDEYYVTSCGHKQFIYKTQCKEAKKNTENNKYNGAWLNEYS